MPTCGRGRAVHHRRQEPDAGHAQGPTGCGKTRFVQHMAYRLGRPSSPWLAMKTSLRPISSAGTS